MAPFFTVIVPTYNRREGIGRCLEALAAQTLPSSEFEVIVAIDGASDDTAACLKTARFPFPLKVLDLNHKGPGHARNAAALQATARFLAFTEDDVEPSRTWLARAYEQLAKDACDVLEGHTGYPGDAMSVRKFERGDAASFIPCNFFVRKDAFEHVGGYSDEFFDAIAGLYFREDSDLGFRLQDAGARVCVDPALVVIHPLQFQTVAACFRHARRYRFDPLLYKRHPRRYRDTIEIKQIGPLKVRRVQLSIAWIDLAAAGVLIGSVISGSMSVMLSGAVCVMICGWLFRVKYQGLRRSLRVYRVYDTIAFVVLPFVYLGALIRGCIRYRVLGVLV